MSLPSSAADRANPRSTGFDPAQLMHAARRETGLADFGDAYFEEGLWLLTDSLAADAGLHDFGRIVWLKWIIARLATRLRLKAFITRYPQVASAALDRPTFIVGFPRTGTTLLYNLLSLDPDTRSPALWETVDPAPPAAVSTERDVEERIRLCERAWRYILDMPSLKPIHRVGGGTVLGKEECTPLLYPTFHTTSVTASLHIPRYTTWLFNKGPDALIAPYQDYARAVRVLMHGHDRRRWLSKSPSHCWFLESLLAVIPNAILIRTVRDSRQAVPSAISLFHTLRLLWAHEPDQQAIEQHARGAYRHYLERTGRFSAMGAPVVEVQYESLVADPLECVQALYAKCDLPFTDAHRSAIVEWIAKHPQHEHGRHVYSAEPE